MMICGWCISAAEMSSKNPPVLKYSTGSGQAWWVTNSQLGYHRKHGNSLCQISVVLSSTHISAGEAVPRPWKANGDVLRQPASASKPVWQPTGNGTMGNTGVVSLGNKG